MRLLVAITGAVALELGCGQAVAAEKSVPMTKIEESRIDRWDPAMDAIVPADFRIEKLAEGFGWAEGPVWVREGSYLLFTDVPGNKMWKWSEKGGLEKFLDPSGAANPDPAVWREAGANSFDHWCTRLLALLLLERQTRVDWHDRLRRSG